MTSSNMDMQVVKRNGKLEYVQFDKISARIHKMMSEANIHINSIFLVLEVMKQFKDKMATSKIDELLAEQCISMSSTHPDYNILASYIVISNHQKNTSMSFSHVMREFYDYIDNTQKSSPIISQDLYDLVVARGPELDAMCDYQRDYFIDYFGFKTLERAYLMKLNHKTLERVQHLWLRVACGIHGKGSATSDADMALIQETYELMSQKYFTHATPTLFNAGTPRPQCSSCFLNGVHTDSLEGIFDNLTECAKISKWSGGIGFHIHHVRATGSHIRGTNGQSTGIVPMLKVYNNTAKYINQGGKRNGSFAVYLEPWHADIEMFLEMRKNHGDEELRARDLFYALWIPDLFMERVKARGTWTLMCPDECPGLADVFGDEFVELYTRYEREGKGRRTMEARELWTQILDAQMETGTPYMVYKDTVNRKSNQKNVGIIKSSNLCVAPETKILTDRGHLEIQSLKGEKVNVWNGQEYSEVEVFQTGTDQELIEVHTSDGAVLTCTKYHKFFIQKGYNKNKIDKVDAQELKIGDNLQKCEYPVIDGNEKILYPDIAEKFYVPFNASLKDKLDWFAGYCDADGSIAHNGTNESLQVGSINREFLLNVKMMLQTCGINPKLRMMRDVGVSYLPDGKGGHKNFDTKKCYRLLITSCDLYKLVELGFSPKRLIIIKLIPNRNACHFIKIEKIVDVGRKDDTYCFTEPKRNAGIFNGILTSQCSEIVQYTNADETAVCNLASIALPIFVIKETNEFDYDKLQQIAQVVTRNLNRVIDINFYPTERTERSNKRHRPIGIGVQGLADTFIMMGLAFDSDAAAEVNRRIFETIAYGALTESCNLAERDGPYDTFAGSPASMGQLQFDLWGVNPTNDRYDWTALKDRIVRKGLRNSLLLAPMPTASTSQILGFNECFEPITSNIYSRGTLAGEFILANKYLMRDMIALGLWNDKIKNNIIENKGSIQHLEMIPKDIRDKYKTVWEISMRRLIDMAADRGVFVCQSQSLNLWLEDPNYKNLTSMHFYAWSKGLKTGIYYLRRRAKHEAQKFSIEPEKTTHTNTVYEEDEVCESCSA